MTSLFLLMRGILQPVVALLTLMAAVPSTWSGASSTGWLQPGHYASYVTMPAPWLEDPGVGVFFHVDHGNPLDDCCIERFSYRWEALSVSSGRAELELSVEAVFERAATWREVAVVDIELNTLKVYDKNGNYLGLWILWIDAPSLPLSEAVEIPLLDVWLNRHINSQVQYGNVSVNPPARTGVGWFEDFFLRGLGFDGVPVPELAAYGQNPAVLSITYRYDVNVGLLIDEGLGYVVDDVLYSLFGIVMWVGPPFLTLNATNVDLTQPVVRTTPTPSPSQTPQTVLGPYSVFVVLGLGGGISYLAARLSKKMKPSRTSS